MNIPTTYKEKNMEKKLYLIQEFATEAERDKALRKVSKNIPCYFTDSERLSTQQYQWILIT